MSKQREKNVKSNALKKMEIYIGEVYIKIKKGESFSLDQLARDNHISGSAARMLKRSQIVEQFGKGKERFWKWIYNQAPSADLALFIIDKINLYQKQTKGNSEVKRSEVEMSTNTAGAGESPKTPYLKPPDLERVMLKRALDQAPQNQLNIFEGIKISVSEKIYLAGCIASGIYSKFGTPLELAKQSLDNIEDVNTAIERATTDLLSKLYNPIKSQSNEKNNQ